MKWGRRRVDLRPVGIGRSDLQAEDLGKSGSLYNAEEDEEVRFRPNELIDPTLPRKATK